MKLESDTSEAVLPQGLKSGLVWLRRDLRHTDNAALYRALSCCERVWVAFIFDRSILDALPRADRRVEFIRESLAQLHEALAAHGGGLIVRHGWPEEAISKLAAQLGVQAVFANHDDEATAQARDAAVKTSLKGQRVGFYTFKDHVIFERREVLTLSASAFTVFTPYKNAWLKKLDAYQLKPYPSEQRLAKLAQASHAPDVRLGVPSLAEIGFEPTNLKALKIPTGMSGAQALLSDFLPRMADYDHAREFPAVKGPSYLGMHLRFGTLSIRQAAGLGHAGMATSEGARVWLAELIWRDFYAQILANFPHAAVRSFKPPYDAIPWEQGEKAQTLFDAWCEGRTGYPLVDAAMLQLKNTGYMHNRLRMVTASFLTKDLGLDWRWGERHFALHLNDFDLASNNGGWQWAASSGCDAQPYFRIFNPVSQSQKFDAEGKFIKRYLPQLAGLDAKSIHAPWEAPPLALAAAGVMLGREYPLPVITHNEARLATLERYSVVKKAA